MSDIFHNLSGTTDVVLYPDYNTMGQNTTSIEATKLHFNKKTRKEHHKKTPISKSITT
jgi:hypothetical protein